MSASLVGKRYARALFELASEAGTLDRVQRDLGEFASMWQQNRELRTLFENPAFGAEVRRSILLDIAAQAQLHEHVRDLLRLLADRRRLRYLPDVREAFDAMREARSGKVRAEVTTAAELPEAYFTELSRTLATVLGREVTIVKKVDPSLIGGVVTQVGDQVFDGSLRHRLGELRDELLR